MKKLIGYEVLISVTTLIAFFIGNYYGNITVAYITAIIIASFIAIVAPGINTLPTVAVTAVAAVIFVAIVVHLILSAINDVIGTVGVICIIGIIIGVAYISIEYAKDNNLSKNYVLSSLITEFIIIAIPIFLFYK